MTDDRRMVLQFLIDAIDAAAFDHMVNSSPEEIDKTFLSLWDATEVLDHKADGRPARYMPILEEVA